MAISAISSPWYLAQVKPNCSQIARRNLERQGFTTFAPFEEETRQRGGKSLLTRLPLFPGYLFVSLDPETSPWRKINSTLGIARLVAFGTRPAPVPQTVIEDLMLRCDADGRLTAPAPLNPGDQVRIKHGPFSSFVAQVERIEPNRRVWVLIDIMGGEKHVAIPQADLRLAS